MWYEFTEEEKELIANTPITIDCFEMDDFISIFDNNICRYAIQENQTSELRNVWDNFICVFENLRQRYNETKDERYFIELVRLLPNSYKAVNLHRERKDKCVNKHFISRYPTQRESDLVPCYEERSCDGCSYFKEKLEETGGKHAV